MKNKIKKMNIEARKNKEKEVAATLSLVLNRIQMKEIKDKRDLTDEEIINIIESEIKQNNEALVFAERSERLDLIEEIKSRLKLLNQFVPTKLTKDEILLLIKKEGFTKENKINEIMPVLMAKNKSVLDGNLTKNTVIEFLK